jgi:hypothetical protein
MKYVLSALAAVLGIVAVIASYGVTLEYGKGSGIEGAAVVIAIIVGLLVYGTSRSARLAAATTVTLIALVLGASHLGQHNCDRTTRSCDPTTGE